MTGIKYIKRRGIMKKRATVLSIVFLLVAVLSFAADYKKDIVGIWTYDFAGVTSTIDHKADGTFTLVMKDTTVKGTYAVDGKKLVLITQDGKKVPYTIESFDGKKMTVKRDKDGRVIVYNKK
jgi:hypothetical protein